LNPALIKKPGKRLFTGLAGSPLAHVETSAPKTAAAIRAAKWRDKEKKHPLFNQQEAKRKKAERAELKRRTLINETVNGNPNPPFVMRDAPHGKGLLVTGEYDSAKLETVDSANRMNCARRVKPAGTGPEGETFRGTAELAGPKVTRTKEVRAMRTFIRSVTKVSPSMWCQLCNQQIAAELDFDAGFNHLRTHHLVEFQQMLAQINKTLTVNRCTNDHAGMAARHGHGPDRLYCGKCRKLLYKPARKRSDEPATSLKSA
jgi:hypothetical protein